MSSYIHSQASGQVVEDLPVAYATCPTARERTGIMADSRRLLLELIDDLLVVAREAASETRSIGRLVASLCRLDLGKAQSAAVYLAERGFSGHAYRLTQDVERLRQKADEAFRGPFVAELTPDDRKQERRCLGALHSEAHGLLRFLNELNSLVDEDDDAVTAECQPAGDAAAGGEATPREIDEFAKLAGTLRQCLNSAKMLVQNSCDLAAIRDEQWPADPRISPESAETVILSLQELKHNLKLLAIDEKSMESNIRALKRIVRSQVNWDEYFSNAPARDFYDTWHEACYRFVRKIYDRACLAAHVHLSSLSGFEEIGERIRPVVAQVVFELSQHQRDWDEFDRNLEWERVVFEKAVQGEIEDTDTTQTPQTEAANNNQPIVPLAYEKELQNALETHDICLDVAEKLSQEQKRNIIMAHWSDTPAKTRDRWQETKWPPSLGTERKTKLRDKVKTYIKRGQEKLKELASER